MVYPLRSLCRGRWGNGCPLFLIAIALSYVLTQAKATAATVQNVKQATADDRDTALSLDLSGAASSLMRRETRASLPTAPTRDLQHVAVSVSSDADVAYDGKGPPKPSSHAHKVGVTHKSSAKPRKHRADSENVHVRDSRVEHKHSAVGKKGRAMHAHAQHVGVKRHSSKSDVKNEKRANQVRKAIRHVWSTYRENAWGADEIKPISGEKSQRWGEVGMMILESLDTLWIAGMKEEFNEGEQWVRSLTFAKLNHSAHVSLFEMTIRGLGGLLSAHALSGRMVFLDKAQILGEHLLKGFPSGLAPRDTKRSSIPQNHDTGVKPPHAALNNLSWPVYQIDVHRPSETVSTNGFHKDYVDIADVASNVVEFAYLSHTSGDPRYEGTSSRVMAQLLDLSERTGKYLLPKSLDPYSIGLVQGLQTVTVGAEADSYFEYLLKRYLQGGQTERRYLHAWKAAMREMRTKLIRKSDEGLTYVAFDSNSESEMEHLACFVGGMLALGAQSISPEDRESWWLPVGAEITHTCYEMYRRSPSGLAPELVTFDDGIMMAATENEGYRLRPETLESLFYMYRATGNHTYRDWSWNIFQAINSRCQAKYGYASTLDQDDNPELADSQETFLTAETFKYALLIHMPDGALPLDQYVLNTEAHPLPLS